MLQCSDALKRRPILEPQHPVLSILMLLRQPSYKSFVYKLLNHYFGFRQNTSLPIRLELGLQPDHQVSDIRLRGVWPIVAQDPVVIWVGEWRGIPWRDPLSLGFGTSPVESFLADEVDNAAIFGFNFLRPGQVAAERGRIAFEG